ncbi:MAG: hypothetical protein ACXAB7_23175 [Candidatus Kariarchaeaceae archaeon]|jgi:hypothetical protein
MKKLFVISMLVMTMFSCAVIRPVDVIIFVSDSAQDVVKQIKVEDKENE